MEWLSDHPLHPRRKKGSHFFRLQKKSLTRVVFSFREYPLVRSSMLVVEWGHKSFLRKRRCTLKKVIFTLTLIAIVAYYIVWMPTAPAEQLISVLRGVAIVGLVALAIFGMVCTMFVITLYRALNNPPPRREIPRCDPPSRVIGYACPACGALYQRIGYCSSIPCITQRSDNLPTLEPVYELPATSSTT
jgi:hypothetical protein